MNFTNALTLGHGGKDQYGLIIGIGAWLGTIMLFNVWVFIWPNQKKILGIVPASDAEKAQARKTAGMASRTNFVLSIPCDPVHGVGISRPAFLGGPALTAPGPADVAAHVAAALAEDVGCGRCHGAAAARSPGSARAHRHARGRGAVRHGLGRRNLPRRWIPRSV